MAEQVNSTRLDESETTGSGLVRSVESLGASGYRAAADSDKVNSDTDTRDTSDGRGDSDGTDGGDTDATDGGDADGMDIIGDEADGSDADGSDADTLGDSDATDSSGLDTGGSGDRDSSDS